MGIASLIGTLVIWYLTILPLTGSFSSNILIWAVLNGIGILFIYKVLGDHLENALH